MSESGHVESFQLLAEVGRISQQRMKQIMSLLLWAPGILELLLHLLEVLLGKAITARFQDGRIVESAGSMR